MRFKVKFKPGSLEVPGLTEKQIKRAIFRTNLQLYNDAVEGTPVDTGFAQGSWWVQVNREPATNPHPGAGKTPADPAVLMASTSALLSVVNSANYIRRLEYGHSPQNRGWVMRAAVKYTDNLSENLARVAK